MRYRLQRHDGTDCSATMVPITVLRMVPIQRYRQKAGKKGFRGSLFVYEISKRISRFNIWKIGVFLQICVIKKTVLPNSNSHIKCKLMKKKYAWNLLLLSLSIFGMIGCDKDEALPDKHQNTEKEEVVSSPQWDILIDNSSDDETDISSKYLGIQGWWSIANPPAIYVGAVFPKNSFATSFDREVREQKYPIPLTFSFQTPYMTTMEDVGHHEYLKKMKEAVKSEEYKNFKYPVRPYLVKLAALNKMSDLSFCIDDNDEFVNTLIKIGEQELDVQNAGSLCVGRVVFKGFTVSMETPENGLFIKNPSDMDELVYVRSLTYGTSAYFIIASKYQYREVLTALKGPFTENDKSAEEVLKNSQIILLTVSDINQTANISKSFDELQTYLNNPFMNGETYGYPISCKGQYVKDNAIFVKD